VLQQLDQILERLDPVQLRGLDALLEQYVPQVDRRCRIRPATALGILLRNILLGRRPIYGLQEWAQPFLRDPEFPRIALPMCGKSGKPCCEC
jgi:hypothetical protein